MFFQRKEKKNSFIKPLAITGGIAAIGGLGYLGLKNKHKFNPKKSFLTPKQPVKNPLDDAYSYMGLDKNSNKQNIKQKYRELSRKYHPDMGGNVDDFQRLNDNYSRIRQNLNFSYFLSDIVNF